MEETEYRQKFKVPLNGGLRRAYKEKVEYRKRRRQMELQHQPFPGFSHTEMEGKSQQQKNRKPRKETYSEPVEIENHLFDGGIPQKGKTSGKSDIPRLELVFTPTPPKRPIEEKIRFSSSSGTMTPRGDHSPIMIDVAISAQTADSLEGSVSGRSVLVDRSTQTPLHLLSDLIASRTHLGREFRRSRSFERKLRQPANQSRQRSKSPFASYGAGDQEPTIAGKRTFNVKADAAKAYKYETAVNAARRKGHVSQEDVRKKRRNHTGVAATKGKQTKFVSEPTRQRFPLTEYQMNFGCARE